MNAFSLRPSLPTTAARELGAVHRRTRLLRFALAAGALALLGGSFVFSRNLDTIATSYFAEGSGGIVVLDLSSSVDRLKYQRVQRVLNTFADTEGRVGLVVFSDSAYEMFPPDTRTEELRPLLKFFKPQFRPRSREEARRQSRERQLTTPWDQSFRGGTKISTGLAEARRMIERDGNPALQVLLVSDLDDSAFDTSALTEELITYERTGIDLRVVPLFPSRDDRAFFTGLVGKDAYVQRDELLANSTVRERQTVVGEFPWALMCASAGLLLLLGLNERACARLAWRAVA